MKENGEILFALEIEFLFAVEDCRLLDHLEQSASVDPLTPFVPTREDILKGLLSYVTHLLNRYKLGDYAPVETRLSLDADLTRERQNGEFNGWTVTTDRTLQTIVDIKKQLTQQDKRFESKRN